MESKRMESKTEEQIGTPNFFQKMNFNPQIEWLSSANGVWEAKLGEGGERLLSHSGVAPFFSELDKLPVAELPVIDITAEVRSGVIVLKMPLGENETIYGVGLKFRHLRLENSVIHLKTDHYDGVDNGRTHAAVPFHVSSSGYGLLIDSPCAISYYIGTAHRRDEKNAPVPQDRNTDSNWTVFPRPRYIEISIRTLGTRLLLFSGNSMLQVVQRYNLYCGGGCLPPKWGLGFWWRPFITADAASLETIVEEFKRRHFPLSVVGLEPGWQSSSYPCTYQWDAERFPDPAGFCSKLNSKGIRVNLWEDPYVSPLSPLYNQLLPFSASHNVFCGIVPDYSMKEVQEIVKRHHMEEHFKIGISGYKLDETDGKDCWLWPDHTEFPSKLGGHEMRQLYGLCFQRVTYELYRENNVRTCGLSRSTNAGSNSFPYVIYNDNYAFDEYVTALCDCGFSGVLWTPELRNAANAEDWLRRFQVAALAPMTLLNGWADNTFPWMFPEIEDEIRTALELRESLTAYLYSAFAKYHFEGIPPFRAPVMDYGEFMGINVERVVLDGTNNPYAIAGVSEIKNQFFVGDSLLVTAVAPGTRECQIVLPPGDWFDFYTGEEVGSGGIITKKIGAHDPLPILVKNGAVIPLVVDNVLKVYIYGDLSGEFILYDDDGCSFDFESGAYNLTRLTSDGKIEIVRSQVADSYSSIEFKRRVKP